MALLVFPWLFGWVLLSLIIGFHLTFLLTLDHNEPTWRCHQNPFIGALGIQEPVIPGEPLIKG